MKLIAHERCRLLETEKRIHRMRIGCKGQYIKMSIFIDLNAKNVLYQRDSRMKATHNVNFHSSF